MEDKKKIDCASAADRDTLVCVSREEWLEERKKGLGASDAGAYMGVSPWKSNEQLWEEKRWLVDPEDISDSPAVKYGNEAEPLLRAFFGLDHPEYVLSFTPYKIIRPEAYPYIFCTPDGELLEKATGRRGGLEIKTTEIRSSLGWTHWDGQIPDYYFAQVCHQMLAAGWEFVELLVQIKYTTRDGEDRKEVRHYKIEREDCLADIAILQHEAETFWRCVETGTRPGLKLPSV